MVFTFRFYTGRSTKTGAMGSLSTPRVPPALSRKLSCFPSYVYSDWLLIYSSSFAPSSESRTRVVPRARGAASEAKKETKRRNKQSGEHIYKLARAAGEGSARAAASPQLNPMARGARNQPLWASSRSQKKAGPTSPSDSSPESSFSSSGSKPATSSGDHHGAGGVGAC